MSSKVYLFAAILAAMSPGCKSSTPVLQPQPTVVLNQPQPEQNASSRHSAPTTGGAATPKPAGATRPVMEAHTGSYFRWMAPSGWIANESANGVDLTSPDGSMSAASLLLMGSPGQTTTWGFYTMAMKAAGASNLVKRKTTQLPGVASGYPGIKWELDEFEVLYTDPKGKSNVGSTIVGVCNAYGAFSAVVQSYAASPARFTQASVWLPVIGRSVTAINPGNIAHQDQLIPVRNHPLDNSPLLESWRAKGLSEDRISQARREATMGYERVKSPSTGKLYNMPLETYDGAVAGYRNPEHPSEILKKAEPGE